MALGPKAMGEAIIANLKTKTGKDLSEWRAELERRGVSEPAEGRKVLKALGLGQFQAVTVIERHFTTDAYADERRLVNQHFERFPEQRALYDAAVTGLVATQAVPQPCRGYLPVYRDRKIIVSFKPTSRGLYAALTLTNRARWPAAVPHRLSLGGSARLKDGVYLTTRRDVTRLLGELTT
jgi:hypothetical protein